MEYCINSERPGKVIILNHEKYDNTDTSTRRGTEQDLEKLLRLLPKLGFQRDDILVFRDPSKSAIFKIAEDLLHDSDLAKCDCLFVFILTHGDANDKLCAWDDDYHLYELVEKFSPTTMTSMAGKLKAFFIQACRGPKRDPGVEIERMQHNQADHAQEDPVDSGTDRYPRTIFPDMLLSVACHYGHYSIRNPRKGSWYIQELCNMIEEYEGQTINLYDIVTATNQAVSKRISTDKKGKRRMQAPSFSSTLTKKPMFRVR